MTERSLKLINGGKTDQTVGDNMEEVTETPAEEKQSVFIVRLTTGEDVIADLIGGDEDTITVINPLVVVMQPNDRGMGLQLAPFFLPYARGPIRINTGNIVALLKEFDPQILDNYRQFFSPIIQPPKGIVS